MKKYTPSVKNNNAVKEELCSEMKGLLYRIEKGKYDRRLDRDGVRDVYDTLKLSYENLEDLIFTGEEDLALVSERGGKRVSLLESLEGCLLVSRGERSGTSVVDLCNLSYFAQTKHLWILKRNLQF